MIARIKSDNFNGKSVNITFTPDTGGTININNVVIPYDYSTDYPYGSYSIEVIGEGITCPLEITSPVVATPTPTPTTTATPTPTITPTATPTPTPSPFVGVASISPTGTTKYNFLSLTGSTNITSPTYVWSLTDFYDYSGNSITSYTGQTTPVGEFRSSGNTLVQLVVTGLNPSSNPVTATTTNFIVNVPTTYRMWFNQVNTTSLFYTDDLINFSSTTLPNTFNDSVRSSIEYSPALDMYVLGEDDNVYYSYDGISWSGASVGVPVRVRKVIWVPKFQMFASIGDRNNYFIYSYDGINWNSAGTFAWGDLGSDIFVWDDVNELFIMNDLTGDIWTSTGGTSWSLTKSNAGSRFDGLTTYKGRTTYVETNGQILYSDDGLIWSGGSSTGITTGGVWSANVLPNGRRFTTGSAGVSQGNWSISDDGISWTGITSPTGSTANTFAATYNETEGKIVVNGGSLLLLVSSDQGETYSVITGPSTLCNAIGIKYNIT